MPNVIELKGDDFLNTLSPKGHYPFRVYYCHSFISSSCRQFATSSHYDEYYFRGLSSENLFKIRPVRLANNGNHWLKIYINGELHTRIRVSNIDEIEIIFKERIHELSNEADPDFEQSTANYAYRVNICV